MDNLCVNVRKVNKGEKQPFTIKLFQKRTDESKLPVLNRMTSSNTFLNFQLGKTAHINLNLRVFVI